MARGLRSASRHWTAKDTRPRRPVFVFFFPEQAFSRHAPARRWGGSRTDPRGSHSFAVFFLHGGSYEVIGSLLTWESRREREGRGLGLRSDSATRAGRPPGIPFPSLPPPPAPPRPHREVTVLAPARWPAMCHCGRCVCSDWALCSPASLTVSAVCGSRCLCAPALSAYLVSLGACVWRVPVIIPVYMTPRGCLCLCVWLAPVSVFCLALPLHRCGDHVCLCTCRSVFAFTVSNRARETLQAGLRGSLNSPES